MDSLLYDCGRVFGFERCYLLFTENTLTWLTNIIVGFAPDGQVGMYVCGCNGSRAGIQITYTLRRLF